MLIGILKFLCFCYWKMSSSYCDWMMASWNFHVVDTLKTSFLFG